MDRRIMSKSEKEWICKMVVRINNGDQCALNELTKVKYERLRRIAKGVMRKSKNCHTWGTSGLMAVGIIGLIKKPNRINEDSESIFRLFRKIMKEALIDYERKKEAKKRGGNRDRVSLENAVHRVTGSKYAARVYRAFGELKAIRPELFKAIEMRRMLGYTKKEACVTLKIDNKELKRRIFEAETLLLWYLEK